MPQQKEKLKNSYINLFSCGLFRLNLYAIQSSRKHVKKGQARWRHYSLPILKTCLYVNWHVNS